MAVSEALAQCRLLRAPESHVPCIYNWLPTHLTEICQCFLTQYLLLVQCKCQNEDVKHVVSGSGDRQSGCLDLGKQRLTACLVEAHPALFEPLVSFGDFATVLRPSPDEKFSGIHFAHYTWLLLYYFYMHSIAQHFEQPDV